MYHKIITAGVYKHSYELETSPVCNNLEQNDKLTCSLSENTFTVPKQLQNERFIILKKEDKLPLHTWGDPWYRYTAAELPEWIKNGFNYGVIYTTDLAVLDVDNLPELEKYGIPQQLADTFKVRSGRASSKGMHFYLRVQNVPEEYQRKKLSFINGPDGSSIGDIRLPGSPFYNVGPYSVHPKTGKQYLPEDVDAEIRSIDFKDLYDLLKKIILPPKEKAVKTPIELLAAGEEKKAAKMYAKTGKTGLEAYNFNCFDFLTPINPHTRADGEVEGAHPIHGSSTGTNLTISADGTKWYCRAHETGGGWLTALAVSEGIIECQDVGVKNFSPDDWRRINDILKKLDPVTHRMNYLEWRKAQILREAEQRRAEA